MKTVETMQRAENGGHPVANEDGTFGHGEYVLIVSKRDLIEFVEKTKLVVEALVPNLPHIAYSPIKELNELLIEIRQFQRENPNTFVFPR
jgi:hypothetical protein